MFFNTKVSQVKSIIPISILFAGLQKMHFWHFWKKNTFLLVSLFVVICWGFITFSTPPKIFPHQFLNFPYLYIGTIAIFASISVAMIFCTCAKIYIQSLAMDLESRSNNNTISTRLHGNSVIQQEATNPEIQIGNSIIGGPRQPSRHHL